MEESRQKLVLIDRKELSIGGVNNVVGFDSERIELNSRLGGIEINGSDLKIAALNLNEGKIAISGMIDAIIYGKNREEAGVKHRGKSMLSRLMK